MSGWVKIPESWLESDEVEQLGADAVLLHLSALGYSCRHGSDGTVPTSALRRLWPVSDTQSTLKVLSAAGEWQATDTGWYLPNWREHLLSKSEVEHRRQVSRETSERHRRHKAGDHSMCDRCAVVRGRGDKADDTSGDKSRDVPVTSPDSTRLDSTRNVVREERRGESNGAGARSAGAPRTPRLLVGGNPPPDVTPWDIRVIDNDHDDDPRHVQVSARPALDREDAEGFTAEQLDAGYRYFVALATEIRVEIDGAFEPLRNRHGCDMAEGCQFELVGQDVAPMLSLTVPRPLGEAWLKQLADAFQDRITKEVAA